MVRKAKRSRGFEPDDAPAPEDCQDMLAKLPHDKITDMLKEVLEQNDCPELRWAIKNARDKQQGKPMDAEFFTSRASAAFPTLTDQATWGRHGPAEYASKVERKLGELVQEAEALPPADSFRALVGVFEGALSDGYEEGLGKEIWQYGWSGELAKQMLAQLEQVKEVERAQRCAALLPLSKMSTRACRTLASMSSVASSTDMMRCAPVKKRQLPGETSRRSRRCAKQ